MHRKKMAAGKASNAEIVKFLVERLNEEKFSAELAWVNQFEQKFMIMHKRGQPSLLLKEYAEFRHLAEVDGRVDFQRVRGVFRNVLNQSNYIEKLAHDETLYVGNNYQLYRFVNVHCDMTRNRAVRENNLCQRAYFAVPDSILDNVTPPQVPHARNSSALPISQPGTYLPNLPKFDRLGINSEPPGLEIKPCAAKTVFVSTAATCPRDDAHVQGAAFQDVQMSEIMNQLGVEGLPTNGFTPNIPVDLTGARNHAQPTRPPSSGGQIQKVVHTLHGLSAYPTLEQLPPEHLCNGSEVLFRVWYGTKSVLETAVGATAERPLQLRSPGELSAIAKTALQGVSYQLPLDNFCPATHSGITRKTLEAFGSGCLLAAVNGSLMIQRKCTIKLYAVSATLRQCQKIERCIIGEWTTIFDFVEFERKLCSSNAGEEPFLQTYIGIGQDFANPDRLPLPVSIELVSLKALRRLHLYREAKNQRYDSPSLQSIQMSNDTQYSLLEDLLDILSAHANKSNDC